MWGNVLASLGIILTSLGLFFYFSWIISNGWQISPDLMAAVIPFIVIGLPSLIVGIFIISNP
jgi:hypothetical protein